MEPAAFDWTGFLQQCALLGVHAAAWTFCGRAIMAALRMIG